MQGYVEQLEKDHFDHADACGCEVDQSLDYSQLFAEAAAGPHSRECDCGSDHCRDEE